MPTSPPLALRPSRSAAVAATIALHLALIGMWQFARMARPPPPDAESAVPIQWIKLSPPPRVQAPPSVPVQRPSARPAAPTAPPAPSVPPPITLAAPPEPLPAPAAPATRNAEDILRQARRDIGKIDQDLRKESPGQIRAPADTALTRLAAGIESATAPPKLWQAPKIENVQDQGGYDRRIYKVTTGAGVYCIYYESNHAPDGLDSMKRGIPPKIMSCPREK